LAFPSTYSSDSINFSKEEMVQKFFIHSISAATPAVAQQTEKEKREKLRRGRENFCP